ncbi:MAG: glycosyltransferase family 39 protein [Nitrososphaerota archaeon]|uniref:glycosyltransferase family 39 protein n=1 Tax=Candidatus Bathycorpusculum sp. TaxID=2994959 RepID=UPI002835FF5B|nr:glycosyltransferase family 39 protein [Candidatus Termiticorpusculum sp.]MCL2256826.1 glycosyltransferase family 39 protein [Candidatus Termiticorpusculum sp.]MCL2293095.1 glycosyltransferase family 39 protein [Candidatus Termiticorpusculum sp.]MDR0460099.1 glycosyltransferase family 39 protein [Nitrososphaerota archaeon]
MILKLSKDKLLELLFLTGFSTALFLLFYSLLSANGLILGNDPSVHLARAQDFLSTGQISLANLGWTPPLYQILLAFLISLTGATNIAQILLLVKVSAVVVNWLLIFSVYLIAKRFFNKKTGMVAAVLLLLCFPMFELNMWGGYTSVLGIAFMMLLFLYLPLSIEHKSYMVVAGVSAFALVLSHQLTMFVAALILVPIMLFLIIKSRGKGIKALLFIIIGGGLAFFLYYVRAMLPYLGGLIEHIFFAQKAMAYQIPGTSLSAFWSNFGFVFILGIAGLFVAAYKLWLEKKHVNNITLVLSFVILLFLAESFVFGLYLPFRWFVYYLMPFITIFASVMLLFIVSKFLSYYKLHKTGVKRFYLKVVVVGLIVLSCFALVMRGSSLGAHVNAAITFYSASDPKALDAGLWLKANYPEPATVIVTSSPGFWFRAFCEKNVIAATDQIVERNAITESVLSLSYEIETPLTLLRVYEAKGDTISENYISINNLWLLDTFCSISGDYVSYNIGGEHKTVPLTQMTRYYTLNSGGGSSSQTVNTLTVIYANDDILVSQTQLVQSSSYAIETLWDISPVDNSISNVTLYTSTFFDLQFNFNKAYLPGALNWENPWDNPSDSSGDSWAVTDFSKNTLTDNYVVIHDELAQIYYAMEFNNLPDWGNIGALGNKQIDAIRLSYKFEQINTGKHASFSYKILTFSEESYYQTVQRTQINEMFTAQPPLYFTVVSRSYIDFIKENNVSFLVYDRFQLDTKLVRNEILDLVYSNDRYTIFKVNQ